jgi:hypothetical protein
MHKSAERSLGGHVALFTTGYRYTVMIIKGFSQKIVD